MSISFGNLNEINLHMKRVARIVAHEVTSKVAKSESLLAILVTY